MPNERHATTYLTHSITFVALLFLLVRNATAQTTNANNFPGQIDSEASLNLNAILENQLKLADQCRHLETTRLNELRRLVEFEKSNNQLHNLHLSNQEHYAIRLPAVCLLLIGPPGSKVDEPANRTAARSLRLDLVNWVFEPEELNNVVELQSGKRHTNSSGNLTRKRRQTVELGNASANNFPISDYLFDANHIDQPQSKSKDELETQKFADQLVKLTEDEHYKLALNEIGERVANYLSPVVLVPGLAGSRMEARFIKQQTVNIICSKQSDWQNFWISLRSFLPVAIDCWIDNARLVYDPASGFAKEPAGIEARVADFGSVESVRHLDLRSPKLTQYFEPIIERYLSLGYQDGKNLFAAPYDFRLAPQQLEQQFFPQLRQLIERAHSASGAQKKVTLVCHSMGCTNLLVFLRQQSAAWRQSKVRKLIAIASPWGGSVKALKALLVGEQFALPIVSETKMMELARTFPSIAYLLPQAEVFGRPNKFQVDGDSSGGGAVLVQTPQKTYSVAELQELLEDAQLGLQWTWFKRTTELLKPLQPLPDLKVDCLHSLNIPTAETILFRNQTDFPDGNYEVIFGDGDGTVNHQSLSVCADWAAQLPHAVRHKIILNTSHTGMLSHKQVLDHITKDVALQEDMFE